MPSVLPENAKLSDSFARMRDFRQYRSGQLQYCLTRTLRLAPPDARPPMFSGHAGTEVSYINSKRAIYIYIV